MNLERLTEQYLKEKAHLEVLSKRVSEFKDMLVAKVDEEGVPDDKGHKWLSAGRYQLQRQWRQGDPYLDTDLAEEYARSLGIWDDVKVTRESLDHDALAGWLYDHKDETNPATGVRYEAEYRNLFVIPKGIWAFQPPKEQQYDEY